MPIVPIVPAVAWEHYALQGTLVKHFAKPAVNSNVQTAAASLLSLHLPGAWPALVLASRQPVLAEQGCFSCAVNHASPPRPCYPLPPPLHSRAMAQCSSGLMGQARRLQLRLCASRVCHATVY